MAMTIVVLLLLTIIMMSCRPRSLAEINGLEGLCQSFQRSLFPS